MKLYARVAFAINAMTKAERVAVEVSEAVVDHDTTLTMEHETTDYQYFGALNVGFAAFLAKGEGPSASQEPRCLGGTLWRYSWAGIQSRFG
jgi:hypothetical protein